MSAADTYARLVDAGAPDLPEGRFYRIRERRFADDALIVELREHKSRGGSRRLEWDYVMGSGSPLTRVVAACARVVEWHAARTDERSLIGDHP